MKSHEKAIVIDALRDKYPLKELLITSSMAKSSYCYQELALNAPDRYKELRDELRSVFTDSREGYSYRRLHAILKTNGRKVSEKVIWRIMSEENMEV
jgi:hypothetical protein